MGKRINKKERAYRRAVAIEYMQSGKDRQQICLKYGLKNQATLSNWVANYLTPYEIETKCVSLHLEEVYSAEDMQVAEDKNIDQTATIEALQNQIARLEKALKKSEDKNLALNTLIDIAEEQGLKIRKKSGVKQ